jgi:hypothetical protein
MKTIGLLALVLIAAVGRAGVLPSASPAAADGLERHSGTLVTIDRLRDVVTIDEIGAWDPATERMRTTRHRIYVTGLTEFKVFVRSNAAGAYAGDFAAVPLFVSQLIPGDTVTAECVRAGSALVAMSIAVADAP